MRKPDGGLDDYIVRPDQEKPADPPRAVSLKPTGDVEVLKPLARFRGGAKPEPTALETRPYPSPYRLSWFHRSLVVGAAVVMIALVFVSAIIIGISEQSAELVQAPTDAAQEEQPVDTLIDTDGPFDFDIYSPASELDLSDPALRIPRRVFRSARPRVGRAAYKPRIRAIAPQPEEPKFIPTTLVIYPENGEIKTRVEPWLVASYKRPQTFTN